MKAIVTGGAGFIGSHMVDFLIKKNFTVIVIDNLSVGSLENLKHIKSKKFKIVKKDIRKIKKNDKIFKNTDFVFHFAGIGDIVPSIEKPLDYLDVNVNGTIKILEACRYNKIKKLVYAASSSCYGIAKTPTDEKHPIDPKYPYALSKYIGEMCCFHWARVYGLKINSIRIFNAYGTRSKTTGTYGAVFGIFLKQLIENKPLTVVGSGNQKRDFVYVTDVVRAFFLAAKSNYVGEIFNLGSGNPIKINNLIKLLKTKKIIKIPKRPGEPDVTHANILKIKKKLNWMPKISFKNGVEQMMNNLEYWKNAPLWNKKNISKATKNWFKYMRS